VELNYGYALITQSYGLSSGFVGVPAYSHEISADYVLRFPRKHWSPFVLAGVGGLIFDPKDFTGKGVEGGIAAGIVGGTGPVTGEVFLEAQLDDPVQPISIPTPRYPPVLQSAGIAGSVDLQYIVDTTGHAEPNSFKVMKTTHPAFVEPAQEAIRKGVFKPAKFKGQPVRQLVQQRISFKVGQ